MSNPIAIFIFHRDLRIKDNIGFHETVKKYNQVIPIFIYSGLQIDAKNEYKSDRAINFMSQSLIDLDRHIRHFTSGKLYKFYSKSGDETKIISQISKSINNVISAVCFNIDYTPFAKERTKLMKKYCNDSKIACDTYEDYLLAPIGTFNKSDGPPYRVFTPFYINGEKQIGKIPKPKKITAEYKKNVAPLIKNHKNYELKLRGVVNQIIGGREFGITLLRKITTQRLYDVSKDILTYKTTGLSPYIKFGCVSIREVYWYIKTKLGANSKLISQLYWREFYYYIIDKYPGMLKNKNFQNVKVKWNTSAEHKKLFKKWMNGKTGFPIVDAGMRELNETGNIHGRSRLITANFLTRIYGINWRIGEAYYARQLIDYDPAVNNGNWQWVASVGVDTKHHSMRVFNPILQHKKFDPECEYVKRWIPELKNKTITEIFGMYPVELYKKMKKINIHEREL
jgi:deoxyribodipyrimidine photo-lyase